MVDQLTQLLPKKTERLFDLVKAAGLDVSDWSNFKGGIARAASNPKYCYEWSFFQGEVIILNLWFENLRINDGEILQSLNMRQKAKDEQKPVWKGRASKVDHAIQAAYALRLPLRVIVCEGNLRTENAATAVASKVNRRMLDPVSWAVESYNFFTGECILKRGINPVVPEEDPEQHDNEENGFEGELRRRFVFYRTRERRLRKLKIQNVLYRNNGRLVCEVPRCGFDFAEVYGTIGHEYAEVHHKFPLGKAPKDGIETNLDDLVIVCSNCHAMIHRGGDCRSIESLIKIKR